MKRLACVVLVLAGCGSPAKKTAGPAAPAAADPIAALEARLLAARSVEVRAHIRSSGAVTSEFQGTFYVQRSNATRIEFDGTLEGARARGFLVSDGSGQMQGESAGDVITAPTPPKLAEGLLVGLARMGLLHNVFRLAKNLFPDRTDGSARTWLIATAGTPGPVAQVAGRAARPVPVTMTVGGEKAAEATLWLDEATGVPLKREMVVHFAPGADMQLTETYDAFLIDR